MVKNTEKNTRGKTKARKTTTREIHEVKITNAQYKIGFDQSVSSGVIGIKGEVIFTDDDGVDSLYELRDYVRNFEAMMANAGYLVASKHAPKKNGESKSNRRGNHDHAESESF